MPAVVRMPAGARMPAVLPERHRAARAAGQSLVALRAADQNLAQAARHRAADQSPALPPVEPQAADQSLAAPLAESARL
jgi:hypothetical protein